MEIGLTLIIGVLRLGFLARPKLRSTNCFLKMALLVRPYNPWSWGRLDEECLLSDILKNEMLYLTYFIPIGELTTQSLSWRIRIPQKVHRQRIGQTPPTRSCQSLLHFWGLPTLHIRPGTKGTTAY